jgi:hypothetical protein
MSGHGDSSTLYQFYDNVTHILNEIKDWMNVHTNEVIVLYFGELR